MKTQPDKVKPSEPEWLTQLRLDVAELLEPRELRSQWIGPDKHSTNTAALPELAERRAGGFSWPSKGDERHRFHPALLEQLRRLRDGLVPAGGESGGRRAPSSRLPAGSDVADLVVDIEVGSAGLLLKALTALNRAHELRRRDSRGLRRMVRPDPENALPRLLELIDQVDEQIRKQITRQVHSWVLAARLALSYAAPMARLEQPCPCCSQQTLIVRSDASGDVFCTNPDCLDDNSQPPRWPRATWHVLLASNQQGDTA